MLQAIPHHGEPDGVLQVIFITCERLGGVEGWIDVDQLDLAHVLLS